jgi:ribonuclease HI
VLAIAHSAWGGARHSSWKVPRVQQRNSQHPRASVKLGNTSNRTASQKKLARERAERAIQQVPADAAIVFTDGSGPANSEDHAGAGVIVLMPRHRSSESGKCLKANMAFEEGTNNIGEMWAVGMGLQLIAYDVKRTGVPLKGGIYIFSDSALTVDIIAHRAVPKRNVQLCHAVRREANSINRHNPININWIAGHVGVEGNELADREADRGKRRARQGQGLSSLQYTSNINFSQFLPINQRPYEHHWKPP